MDRGGWVVLLTLLIYQGVLLGIGWWARTRSDSDEAYFIGGRGLGPWVAALSYAAGSSSAWSILGVSGIAFSQGLGAFWLLPGTLSGHLVVWFWLAPRLQKLSHEKGYLTLTDLLADGLGPTSARTTYLISAVSILFCFTFYVAAQFQGAANTFTAFYDIEFLTALLLGALVVVTYTLWGGFWAVSLTDALQAALILLAALLLPTIALVAVGGWSGLQAAAQNDPYWSVLSGHRGWFAAGFLLGMASIGFGPLGQPHLLNRVMAMARGQDIRLARAVALIWFVIVLSGMFLLGVCAHVMLAGQGESESVFFLMADRLLPVVLTGILAAAVLSAIMSTADSQLLVAGAALHHDLRIGAAIHSNGARTARLAVVVVALAAVMLAALLPESIFSRVLFAWNALGAAFGPLVIARLIRCPIADWSAPVAIALGFVLTVVFYSMPDGPGDLWERALPFIAGSVTLVLGCASVRKQEGLR